MNGSGDGSPAAPRGVTGRLERMIRKPVRRRHAARPDRAPIRPASCVLCGGALDPAGSHPVGEPGDGGVHADTAPGWPVTGETAVPPAACTCRTEGGSITAPGGARAFVVGFVLLLFFFFVFW